MSLTKLQQASLVELCNARLNQCYTLAKESVIAKTSKNPADVEGNGGWRYETSIDGIDVFLKKVKGDALNGSKGIGILNAPVDVVFYTFTSPHYRHHWDDMFASGYKVSRIDERTSVSYSSFYAPWPLSGRDIVAVGRIENWDDGSLFMYSISVDHPLCPNPTKPYVRADLKYCGVLLTPLNANTTKMVYAVMSDPRGSLPTWVINAANIKQPACIHAIGQFIARPGVRAVLERNMEREYSYEREHWRRLREEGCSLSLDEDLAVRGPLVPLEDVCTGTAGKSLRGSLQTPTANQAPVLASVREERVEDLDAEAGAETEADGDAEVEVSVDSEASRSTSVSVSLPRIATKAELSTVVATESASAADADPYAPDDEYVTASGLRQKDYSISLKPLPPSKYDTALQQCYEEAWAAVTRGEEDGWKFHSEEEGIKIYMKTAPAGKDINFCKGVGVIDGTPEQIRCVFASSENRKAWDEMYSRGETVEQIDTNTVVSYGAFKAPWPVAPRDFCTLGRSVVLDDGSIFVYYTNFPHPNMPPVKKHIRGILIYSALLIRPVPGQPGRSHVTYALGNDPCGSIPVSIVNAANVKQPLCVAKIGRLIARDKASAEAAVVEAQRQWLSLTAKPVAVEATETIDADYTTASGLHQRDYFISLQPLPPSKYDTALQQCYEEAWAAVQQGEEGGWKFHSEEEGIKIYMKAAPAGKDINFCKGVGVIEGTPEDIRCVFASSDVRAKWDEMFARGETVEQIDTNTVVSYGAFKAPWPVAPRDFCTLGRSVVLDDGSIFVYYTNFPHPNMPPVKKHIRGILIYSALLIKPLPGSPVRSQVIYALGNDPCGSLPTSLVNAANVKQPLCVAKIGRLIARDKASVAAARAEAERIWRKLTAAPAATSVASSGPGGNGTGPGGLAGTQLPAGEYAMSVGPLAPSKYDEVLSQAFSLAWAAASKGEEDGWVFQLEEDGVRVYMKSEPGSELKYCKGVGIIAGTPEQIRCVFAAGNMRPRWDDMYDQGRVLERIDTNTVISYAAFKAPWPVAPRDFCSIGRSIAFDDGSIFVYYTNYEHPLAPTVKKNVRGRLIFSALYIRPVQQEPSRCEVTYAVGSDPCGSIPVSIVNAANVKQPLCVARIGRLIATDPAALRAAVEFERQAFLQASVGASAAEEKEALAGVWSVQWPVQLGPEDAWLQPLHTFAERSALTHIRDCITHAKAQGGWFPLADPVLAEITPSPLPIGVLAVRMLRLKGSYLPVLKGLRVYFTVAFGDARQRTAPGPVFSKADAYCFDVHSPQWTLELTLWGEQRDQPSVKSCLGTLSLRLGELFEGSGGDEGDGSGGGVGSGDPSKARRGWFALSNIPVEIDRAATHADILAQRAAAQAKAKGKEPPRTPAAEDPRGIFVCLESCVVLSTARWFLRELHSHGPLLQPPSVLSSQELNLPSTHTQSPAELLATAPQPKNKALCELVGAHASSLVSCGPLSSLAADDYDKYAHVDTATGRARSYSATAPACESVVSAELCVRNIARMLWALAPLVALGRSACRIVLWDHAALSLLALIGWVFVCTHAALVPTLLCLLTLCTLVLTAANAHFLLAHERGANNWYVRSLKRKQQLTAYYSDKLAALVPELSPRAQACVLMVQVTSGRVASLLERCYSLCSWARGDETTATVGFFALVLFVLSLLMPPSIVCSVAVCLLFGWNTTLVSRLREMLGAAIRVHVGKTVLQKDSQIIRLMALKTNT